MNFLYLGLMLGSALVHECGHYVIAAYYHADPRFGHRGLDPMVTTLIPDWESPAKQKLIHRNIGFAGFSFQTIFLLPLVALLTPDPVSWISSIGFLLVGSSSDFNQIRKGKVMVAKSE